MKSSPAAILALPLLASACFAQSAQVVVTFSDEDGYVEPGQTINIKATVIWSYGAGGQFAGIKGDLRSTPDLGSGARISSDYFTGALVSLGHLTGGGVLGVDIAQTPYFFSGGFMVPPSGNSNGIKIVAFDWTAPATGFSGPVRFDFVAPTTQPDVRLFLSSASPYWTAVPTTYVGTSITVTPAPGTLALLTAVPFSTRRRGNRS